MAVTSLLGRGSLRGVHEQATNQKHQTVMIVTGVASNWEYFSLRTNQSLKSAFSGGSHD
jgi:hypothetical protein